MKNLRGFRPEGQGGKTNNQQNPEELIKKYGNLSEDALFENLMSEVASAKSGGNFSAQELKQSVAAIKPYLSEAQSEKLEHLLRLITSN